MMHMVSMHSIHAVDRRRLASEMPDNTRPQRLEVGATIAPFTVDTLAHGALRVPSSTSLVHLQFRRFAGCPVCNLHLRSFARSVDALAAAGVTPIAFMHSTAASMREYQADLPFAVVPDPERRWYTRFAVERSMLALMHPSAVAAATRGMFSAPSNPLVGEGGMNGLPADFLIDRRGALVAVKYGEHAADHWEVAEVIALAQAHAPTAATVAAR